ncbi:hypothetical protein GCM10018980_51660 [Streptomyces capoamus]|uniref:Uncharacterized protein n=1 Tax=Streptomyces capoamus TaxID=68183 RepID=A0A919EZW9_9ACTN|nr:hypothetical protein GCM10010501_29150 [Streptomyces libani subsp. rufus]GHG62048.1 hypothetical protein GCM10018980_51660 [Streptomyces capoamus]
MRRAASSPPHDDGPARTSSGAGPLHVHAAVARGRQGYNPRPADRAAQLPLPGTLRPSLHPCHYPNMK